MKTSIPSSEQARVFDDLRSANLAFLQTYPGDSGERQPVHTVYGGANLFGADTAARFGAAAMKALRTYVPNFATMARAFELPGHAALPESEADILRLQKALDAMSEAQRKVHPGWLAYTVFNKVVEKLEREALEDFRIDFEDGFGNRADEEEDRIAVQAAEACAKGMAANSLPPFIGIRIKPFTEDLKARGARTMDIFLTTLAGLTGGKLPANFRVMLPKVTIPAQVEALVHLFELIEANTDIESGALRYELMVETTQSIVGEDGRNPLMSFVRAGKGRCVAMAFGTYDYTASNNITAHYQDMGHLVNDYAHFTTKVALGQTGIFISDGATNVMPVGPHRGDALTQEQLAENRAVVHRAWKLGYDHTRHSLYKGIYQGWDLHPAQLVARYVAVYTFFLESYEEAAERLSNFIDAAARVTLSGDIFDDAATGQGLLNYFLRALNSGAISEAETTKTGLTLEEIQTRSFYKILEGRRITGH